jgi:protein-disulfide isomerase
MMTQMATDSTAADENVLSVPVTERDHSSGPPDAPVTLVEYGDYECPNCGSAYPILKQLRARLGDRLRFVFRNFPLMNIHARASIAAQAAEAAAAQGKFWQMHDQLYEHQRTLANEDLERLAIRIGLELYKFNADVGSGRFVRRVNEDIASGAASGVKGTPTFFINGRRYTGPNEFESLAEALERAME